MPTSSRAARAFGVISSPLSAATPALVARYGSPPSSAKALKIDSAIGLRQTFAVQTKSTFFGLFVLALPSVNCPFPLPDGSSRARSGLLFRYVFWSGRIIRTARRFDETPLASVGSRLL